MTVNSSDLNIGVGILALGAFGIALLAGVNGYAALTMALLAVRALLWVWIRR